MTDFYVLMMGGDPCGVFDTLDAAKDAAQRVNTAGYGDEVLTWDSGDRIELGSRPTDDDVYTIYCCALNKLRYMDSPTD